MPETVTRTVFRIKESFLPQGFHESHRPVTFQGIWEIRWKRNPTKPIVFRTFAGKFFLS